MTAPGNSTTTVEEVTKQALSHWGLEKEDWQLVSGEGPFAARDRMDTKLVRRDGEELVEATFVTD
jgi:hypothetical protein